MIIRKSKRASTDWSLIELGSLLVIAIVLIALIMYVSRFAKNKAYEELFLSRDISLLIEASQSSFGDFRYDYPINTTKLGVRINIINNSVFVSFFEKETPVEYWFSKNSNQKIRFEVLNQSLSIEKQGNIIYVVS
ncbi:MAG: type II secretion system protein [Candidatus Woesearchaeota archaeon]